MASLAVELRVLDRRGTAPSELAHEAHVTLVEPPAGPRRVQREAAERAATAVPEGDDHARPKTERPKRGAVLGVRPNAREHVGRNLLEVLRLARPDHLAEAELVLE